MHSYNRHICATFLHCGENNGPSKSPCDLLQNRSSYAHTCILLFHRVCIQYDSATSAHYMLKRSSFLPCSQKPYLCASISYGLLALFPTWLHNHTVHICIQFLHERFQCGVSCEYFFWLKIDTVYIKLRNV